MSDGDPISVIIDTNQYAGNFEREMCAFVTGQYGGCGVGEGIAELARGEIQHVAWWDRHVEMVEDLHGCAQPVAICPTPGWFNDGFGGLHYELLGRREALDAAARGLREALAVQERALEKQIAALPADDPARPAMIERLAASVRLNDMRAEDLRSGQAAHPAHMSVEIFVDEVPPEKVLEELKARAEAFAARYDGGLSRSGAAELVVTGLRIVGAEPLPSPKMGR